MAVNFNLIAQLSTEAMAECLVEGVLLAGSAAILLRFSRQKNAATRFVVWLSVLLTMALLPFAGALLRSRVIAVTGVNSGFISLPESWANYLFLGWIAVVLVAITRLFVGIWQVHRLRQSCVELAPDSIRELGPEIAQILDNEAIRLCVSGRVKAPVAIGFLKPAVVIPDWLVGEIAPSQLRQIIIHELTHLRRHDDWTNLAQKVAAAFLFFHPLAWWIERKLALEREIACDDAVLVHSADHRGYAECLVRVAEKSFMRRGLALAQAAVSRLRHTSLRVAQILDGRPRAAAAWKPSVAAAAVLAATCIGLSWHAPVLIGFSNTAPRMEAATVVAPAPALVREAKFDAAELTSAAKAGENYAAGAMRLEAASLQSRTSGPFPQTTKPAKAVSAAKAGSNSAGIPKRLEASVQSRSNRAHAPKVVQARFSSRAAGPGQIRTVAMIPQQTFILLISAPMPGQDAVQFQMWQITVLRQAVQPDYAPRKAI